MLLFNIMMQIYIRDQQRLGKHQMDMLRRIPLQDGPCCSLSFSFLVVRRSLKLYVKINFAVSIYTKDTKTKVVFFSLSAIVVKCPTSDPMHVKGE